MSKEDVLIEYISNWLANYLIDSGRKVFVVKYNETRSDALLLKICSEATTLKKGLSTICLYQDTKPQMYLGRAYKLDIPHIPNINDIDYIIAQKWADDRDGIVLSSIDKTFGKYYRSYSKTSYSLSDIFPLYDLYYSDIVQITDYLWPDMKFQDIEVDDYKMLEFCIKAENTFGIITSENSPHKHGMWHTFTSTQKRFIGESQQREKKTRHKEVKKPYPKIPNRTI